MDSESFGDGIVKKGVGKKALYLKSFFIDRYYYVPMKTITRVFKRVAMSKGGFSGRGSFASIPYLVVEFDNGQQKQCIFKPIHNGFAVYFVLFGIAAIFTFAGFSMLPTARNNKKSIMNYDEVVAIKPMSMYE